ncbi:tetratricopeptide repeat protein, partial [Planomonospora algeriensis]
MLTESGRLRLADGDHAGAVELFKGALSWAPNDLPARLALGQALWHAGQP